MKQTKKQSMMDQYFESHLLSIRQYLPEATNIIITKNLEILYAYEMKPKTIFYVGAKVCYDDDRIGEVISTTGPIHYPIIILLNNFDGTQSVETFTNDGKMLEGSDTIKLKLI